MRIRITFLGSPFRTCSSKTLLGVLGVTPMALSSSEFLGLARRSSVGLLDVCCSVAHFLVIARSSWAPPTRSSSESCEVARSCLEARRLPNCKLF